MHNVSTSTSIPPPLPAQQQTAVPVPQAAAAPDAEPSKKKRGPKSSLSDDQLDVIQSYFPEMEKLLKRHNLHAGKEDKVADPDAVVTWFDSTITKILRSEAFETLDKSKKTPAQWRVVVRDVFKNYRNNTFIPKNQKTFALRYLQQKNNDTRSPDDFIKAADALVSFKVPAAPKKLFERANKEAIIALMNKKIVESNSVDRGENATTESSGTPRNPNPAALYQNALTELWAKADKQDYIEEASSVDIFKNQGMFQESMYNSLCALAEGGAIGPSEMLLWVGFRDKDDVLQCLRLHAHHRFDPDNAIRPFIEGDEAMKIETAWEGYCEETIPHHDKKSACNEDATSEDASNVNVLSTAAGIPVLPDIDFDNTTRIQLSETLINFRKALWNFSYPADNNMPSVPVARISAHPEDYIDVEKFSQAAQLATVETLDLITLFSLARYLGSVSHAKHATPFTFRTKDDIQRRVHDRTIMEEKERQTGDEIIYDNAPASSTEHSPTSVDPPAPVGTSVDPPSTVDPSSASIAPPSPVDLFRTSVNPPSPVDPPPTSVDCSSPVDPSSASIDPSVDPSATCVDPPGPDVALLDASGPSTDSPPTPLAIDTSVRYKKRKHSIHNEDQENTAPAPKIRKRTRASGGEDAGERVGRVTRASTKQAAEQTSRTLRGGRRGHVVGGPGDKVKKGKGRR
ncbi:hypothetical protein C8R42DRAFT_644734 [Lentinula raphanica]|nr:hypothetical protein C8R42DRAFT_644734 [Lentinula raphanica]